MALREIRRLDDPILRKKSKPVLEITDKIRTLLEDMLDTLHHMPNASGLAACQLGILKRLIVINFKNKDLTLINPEIVSFEGDQFIAERCLSFPGLSAEVHRPEKIVVSALNEMGETIIIEGSHFLAGCLSHEIDHLDGIVFIDKAMELTKV